MNTVRLPQRGFTLIELMIVIAVVAILVALAIPAYQDYTIRSKVGECISNAVVGKLSISEFRLTEGVFPANAGEAGLGVGTTVHAGASEYCNVYLYSGGNTFTVQANNAAIDSNLTGVIQPVMTAAINPTSFTIDWTCTLGTTSTQNTRYLPATCRGT
jgi:prepilin-type N-terminal cleavage/methylation domain-containing protein